MFQISEFRCSYGDPRVLSFCFGNSACHTIDIKGDKRIFERTVLSWLLQPSFIQIVHVWGSLLILFRKSEAKEKYNIFLHF